MSRCNSKKRVESYFTLYIYGLQRRVVSKIYLNFFFFLLNSYTNLVEYDITFLISFLDTFIVSNYTHFLYSCYSIFCIMRQNLILNNCPRYIGKKCVKAFLRDFLNRTNHRVRENHLEITIFVRSCTYYCFRIENYKCISSKEGEKNNFLSNTVCVYVRIIRGFAFNRDLIFFLYSL